MNGEADERPKRTRPCDYLASGKWPEGPLTNEAPPEAYLAQEISRKAILYLKGRPPKQIAEHVGVSFQTIYNLIEGKTWGSLTAIARLEHYLNRRLWGNEHRKRPRRRTERADSDTVDHDDSGT